jgi:hypothetical protein
VLKTLIRHHREISNKAEKQGVPMPLSWRMLDKINERLIILVLKIKLTCAYNFNHYTS